MLSASAPIQTPEMLHLDQHMQLKSHSPSASSRILDIPCKVCGDYSSGKHYNIFACDGCAGFFKRSIRRNRQYVCKAKDEGSCIIDKTHRNQCRACRLQKCQEAGMNKDAVQHERGPRNSTLKRQQLSFFNEVRERMMVSPPLSVLNLAVPKTTSPSMVDPSFPLVPPPFMCNSVMPLTRMPTPVPIPPVITPPILNPAAICESAARLLFMNVQWAKSIPTFTTLAFSDQLLLLEESWRELFILGAAQFLPFLELSPLVHACGILEREENNTVFLQKAQEFQDILANVRQFQMDQHEFACLRAIVLFKTTFDKPSSSSSSPPQGEARCLSDPTKVAAIQDETQLTLNKYISTAYASQPLRFGKLLLHLPALRNVSTDTIEELFFRKTIGNIPIVRIISDMYKTHTL